MALISQKLIEYLHIEQYKKDGTILIKNAFSQTWFKKIEIGIEKKRRIHQIC